MLCVDLRPQSDIVKTFQHDVSKIAEAVCHGMLESGSIIFEAKGHDSVGECAPWGCECRFVMVFFSNLDLVLAGKSVHEGEGFMSSACIDDLVDERGGEVVFRTCPIKITEFYANMNGTLFLFMGT